MIIYNIKNELNHLYLTAPAEISGYNDYRYRMIADNRIEGLLPLEIRNINGENRLYFDITEKENLIRCVSVKDMEMNELIKLTECMMKTSDRLKDYLMEESCLVFEPDVVFRDIKSGRYEFVCIPGHLKTVEEKREDIVSLLQIILTHLKITDDALVEGTFLLYEMAEAGPILTKTIYEYVCGMNKNNEQEEIVEAVCEEDDLPDEEYEDVPAEIYKYRMSYREWLGIGFAAAGLISIGFGTYLSFIR